MNIGAVALVAVVCTSVAAEPVRKQGPTKEQAFPDDSATCEPAELESPVKGWSFYKVKDFRSESTYLVEDKTKEMLAELVSNELDAEGNEKPGGKSTHSAAELSVTLGDDGVLSVKLVKGSLDDNCVVGPHKLF